MKKFIFFVAIFCGLSSLNACMCAYLITPRPPIVAQPVVTSVTEQIEEITRLIANVQKNIETTKKNRKKIDATIALEEASVDTNAQLAFELKKKIMLLESAINIIAIDK